MGTFTITQTAISHEIHNAVVLLFCNVPGSSQPHKVRVYVSDIFMSKNGIAATDDEIISVARSWAEPILRDAPSVVQISELMMNTTSAHS